MPDESERTLPAHQWLQLPAVRLLVAVADAGSLGAGARSIGMAQSNASRAVATLERRLGYRLLSRSTAGSRLTTEGVLTVEWAREVLDAVERLSAGAAALVATSATELVVGASMTVAEYLVPGWISTFRIGYPDVQTTLRINNSRCVIDGVRSGELALGFIETPDVPGDIRSIRIATDRLVVVISPEHPWAARTKPLTPEELAATPLVEREAGSGTRAALDAAIGADRPRPVAELNSNSAICQSVMAGLGPAVLSNLAVQGALRDGRMLQVPVSGGRLERELRGIWFGSHRPAGDAGRLLDIALQTAEAR
ncbi:LysR family transcriptional regulator [Arthrobacter sp. I2-34]|uniref:LysR family transcriptional regulator n=1 Tax=Arthrobacter hankyongi TaxID=2904801 RepID=A0ABS9L8W3_9MICC|nr:LysR family transcriptional regulator [Arthrobacter hankyongi]MCG2623123.1 LysR family transcriptional regulator [Arthrobacter hankyongi]